MRSIVLSLPMLLGLAAPLQAAYQHHVLLDVDSNEATGCSVNVTEQGYTGGPVAGVDYQVTLHVDNLVSPPVVEQITRTACVGGNLANETQIDGGSWNVGIDNGVSAADVVEGYVPRAAIGNPTQVTAAFFSTRDGFSDLLKTQDGSSTGAKIVVLLGAASVSSVAIPTLSEAMLLLLATLTALMGFRYAQRHGTTLVACTVAIMIGSATHRGVEAAVTILMDGLVGDWSGVTAIATDVTGDSSSADPAEDIVAAFITADAQNVYLRVDVANAEVVQTPITSAPTGLDLLAVSDTGTSDTDNLTNDTTPTLSWNSVINADGYKISFDAGSNWQDVGNTTTWTHPGLADGSYDVLVRAYNSQGDGPVSSSVTIRMDGLAPALTSGLGNFTLNTDDSANQSGTFSEDITNPQVSATCGNVSNIAMNGTLGFTYDYTAPSSAGSCTINWQVEDLAGNVTSGSQEASVESVNTAPTASDVTQDVGGETITYDLAPDISDSETADSDLTIVVVSGPSEGSLVWNTNTEFTYNITDGPGYAGNDSFTYKVRDPEGLESDTKTVTLTNVFDF